MITDDTLLLYYGNELDDEAREHIAHELDRDPELARRYDQLRQDLDFLQQQPAPAAPEMATARWHASLRSAARADRATAAKNWRPVQVAAAAVMLLAIGIVIGIQINDGGSGQQQPVSAAIQPPADGALVQPGSADATVSRVTFSRGLVDYMQTSRQKLATLDSGNDEQRAAVLAEIIAHNRAFERIAETRGADDIARVLRAFDQILQELAQPSAVPGTVDQRIDQLSFEYGAVLTRMAPRASNSYTL